MYKKILVPVDGSALSECVLPHVKAVATGCNVPEVDLLFVVQPFLAFPFEEATGAPIEALKKEGEDKTEAWGKDYVAKVAKSLQRDGVAAKSAVLRGNPSEVILNYAEKNGIDLIIMASHGRSGPARWALGSVADRVVRLSICPVVIVRHSSCTAP